MTMRWIWLVPSWIWVIVDRWQFPPVDGLLGISTDPARNFVRGDVSGGHLQRVCHLDSRPVVLARKSVGTTEDWSPRLWPTGFMNAARQLGASD